MMTKPDPQPKLRWLLLAPLLLVLANCGGPQIATERVPPYGLYENPQALRPFFSRLARIHNTGGTPLRILQLGDSHTAADFMSGRLRESFHAKFGNAGRGMLPPGRPFRGIRENDFRLETAGRWEYENSLNPRHSGPFGASGFLARNLAQGAEIILDSNDGFEQLSVTVWKRPNGGLLDVRVDNRTIQRVSTAGEGAEILRWRVPANSRQLRLIAADRKPVTILGYAIEKAGPGIVYDSLGVVGATIAILGKYDAATLRQEVADRDPALIVLAFGTNEGFNEGLDEAAYRSQFVAAIRALRAAAPHTAIAVIGPPDAQRNDGSTPASLARVRAIQRDLAGRENFFFWDWNSIMLASGGINAWANADPPLARPDRVHLSQAGYSRSADAFYAALMREYEAFSSGRPAS